MPEMAGIRSTLIKEKNMITNYEATVVTTDDIVHEVNLEGKRIGYVIKTENKEFVQSVWDLYPACFAFCSGICLFYMDQYEHGIYDTA